MKFALYFVLLLNSVMAFAGTEPYEKHLKGKIRKGDSLIVKDEKFSNPDYNWDDIARQSVKNVIVFQLTYDTPMVLKKAFTCELELKVEYLSQPDQPEPLLINSVKLKLSFSPDSGSVYKAMDSYTFGNGHWVKITVVSISSPELGDEIPPVLQITNKLFVDRKYLFKKDAKVKPFGFMSGQDDKLKSGNGSMQMMKLSSGTMNNYHLLLNWDHIPGAEEYDIEWATVDIGTDKYAIVQQMLGNDISQAHKIFRNNATRVTTFNNEYDISMLFNSDYIVVRMRQVSYDEIGKIRDEDDWDYLLEDDSPALWEITDNWHESTINWQYNASFAEEGKKKEVMSYFDGTLRNKQSVTSNYSDNVSIVQETVFDPVGRPVMSILPAPVNESNLHYFRNFNNNYTFSNMRNLGDNCERLPQPLHPQAGAANYYSTFSPFKNTTPYNKYIPDAEGYPMSVTQYVNDNTGRVRLQGGVGAVFQPGTAGNHISKYYYGKPETWELDRLFGNDVGYANHYFKSMVIDPNGQISVSYLNSSGRTIATAFTGEQPQNMDGLPSKPTEHTETMIILRPDQFVFDASSLSLTATTTYLASIPGAATFGYDIEKLIHQYTGPEFQICSNCYYDLQIKVKNDCNQDIYSTLTPLAIGSKTANCSGDGLHSATLNVDFPAIGEYYITYSLALSRDVMERYTETYIYQRQQEGTVKDKLDFIVDYLTAAEFENCFDDCRTCDIALGTKSEFVENAVILQLNKNDLSNAGSNPLDLYTWAEGLYDALKANCNLIRQACFLNTGNPCSRYEELMFQDVSPGGQYALFQFSPGFLALEQDINVLFINWRTEFPIRFHENSEYQANLIALPDGTLTSPNDVSFTLQMLVQYWKIEWAQKFVKYHPEKCKLNFCEENKQFINWDDIVKNDISKASDIPLIPGGSGLEYDRLDPDWLLSADPFFNQTGSAGVAHKNDMSLDLNLYSTRILKLSIVSNPPTNPVVKSLTTYVDFLLYCSNFEDENPTTRWNGCSVDPTCRVIDREWEMYKQFYFQQKEKYYLKAREEGACENSCTVGESYSLPSNCASIHDFLVEALTLEEVPVGTTPCSSGYSYVRLSNGNGSVGKTTTVTLYYPEEYASMSLPTSYVFNVGESQKIFCVPNEVVVSAIKVSQVACDQNSGVYPDCPFGTYGELRLEYGQIEPAAFGYVINERKYEVHDQITGLKTTYWVIGENEEFEPVEYYCPEGTYHNTEFFNCFKVFPFSSFPIQFFNVYVVTCQEPLPSLRSGEEISTESLDPPIYCGDSEFSLEPMETGTSNPTIQFRVFTYNNHVLCEGQSASVQIRVGYYPNGIPPLAVYTQTVTFGSGESSKLVNLPTSVIIYSMARFACGTIVGECEVDPEPPYECPVTYLSKTSRFPHANFPEQINPLLQSSEESMRLIVDQIKTGCEAQAEGWMEQLENCLVSKGATTLQRNTLKAKLIEICTKGGDLTHPYGASSVPTGVVISDYGTFESAIKGILGNIALDMNCNPWVIPSPYPYYVKPQFADQVLSITNKALCSRLTQLQTDHVNESPSSTFYQFLIGKYGSAMAISETQLNMIIKSCSNCRYILEKEMPMPVFMNPGAVGCITKSTWDYAKLSLSYELGVNYDTQHPNFEEVFSTFLNHRWGFALSYSSYKAYEDLLAVDPLATLCNRPPYTAIPQDHYACIKTQIQVLVNNALRDYDIYIAQEKRKFRMQYTAVCSGTKTNVRLTATQQVYHYTLYYYDQAGNVVRTVPPEGVVFLTNDEMLRVGDARKFDMSSCSYSGPAENTDKEETLEQLSGTLAASGNHAVEMWLYKPGGGNNQFLTSSLTGTDKHLLNVCINNDRLKVDIYKLDQTQASEVIIIQSNHISFDISGQLPLEPWVHITVQGNQLESGTLQVYLNGSLLTGGTNIPTTACGWEIVSGNPVIMPENTATIKHLRLYDRLLTGTEINDNAAQSCLGIAPDNIAQVVPTFWGRFNAAIEGDETTVEGGTVETQFVPVYPHHKLPTSYTYNSGAQVVQQQSPDGGLSAFWYDRLGRITASQNAEQKLPAETGAVANRYSYTKYDALGRITEVGEKTALSQQLPAAGFLTELQITAFHTDVAAANKQVTQTVYDVDPGPVSGITPGFVQENLRKRVAATYFRELGTGPVSQASYYSYDLVGNVKTLHQHVAGLGFKKIDYEYDLASGKVNFVAYQHDAADKFYYRYKYDHDNRITQALTGTSAVIKWPGGSYLLDEKTDATYQYYMHGPLARMELGNNKVQGVDYAYTLQGWLKGINGHQLNASTEMGGDGVPITDRANIGRDVMAFTLGYYHGDYVPIGAVNATAFPMQFNVESGDVSGKNLFNGNISHTTIALSQFNSGAPAAYTYKYDQLNRLTQMRQHTLTGSTTSWTHSGNMKYAETIAYDANGNIKTYLRNGADGSGMPLTMDNLTYHYASATDPVSGSPYLLNNKLRHVKDVVAGSQYSQSGNGVSDIDDQSNDNYSYDKIGNLIGDQQETISNIQWTVYGKIGRITKANNDYIAYQYDPSGNRTTKEVSTAGVVTKTWYVRDAQGNALALYSDKKEGQSGVWWREQSLYGSSRLGIWKPDVNINVTNGGSVWSTTGITQYELTNHLGNVLATITDKKLPHDNGSGGVDYYEAEVTSATDYYPFGMQMPGRTWSSSTYRYGFNGKEMDSDVKGSGNQYDYGFRIYDPRLGRFLSTDPLTKSYPMLTPYQFASNRPIDGIDLDGLEWKKVETYNPHTGVTNVHFQVQLKVVNESTVFNDVENLKAEIQGQFQTAFEGRRSGNTTYSASIDVEMSNSLSDGDFGVLILEGQKREVGKIPIAGMTNDINTKENVFSVTGSIYSKIGDMDPAAKNSKLVAQDIVHELMHTAGVDHPQDDNNPAQDVDLIPKYKTGADGKRKLDTYNLAAGAKIDEVLTNIMIYPQVVIDGKTVKDMQPDTYKRNKVSPDQATIIKNQIEKDDK